MEDPGPAWYSKPAHDLSEKRPLRFIRNRSWKHDQHFTLVKYAQEPVFKVRSFDCVLFP